MKKYHIVLFAITLAIVFTAFCSESAAASALRSSPTLSSYGVVATEGDRAGEVVITYDVLANSVAESLGVSSIKIYKSNGNYVTTIYPTSLNGLKTSSAMWHRSSYAYTGISGTFYYAKVTVFATIDGVTDSRTVTTNTVKAP